MLKRAFNYMLPPDERKTLIRWSILATALYWFVG